MSPVWIKRTTGKAGIGILFFLSVVLLVSALLIGEAAFTSYLSGTESIFSVLSMLLASAAITFLALLLAFPFAFSLSVVITYLLEKPLANFLYGIIYSARAVPGVLLAFAAITFVLPLFPHEGTVFLVALSVFFLAGFTFPQMTIRLLYFFHKIPASLRRDTIAIGSDWGAGFRVGYPLLVPASLSVFFSSFARVAGESIIVFFLFAPLSRNHNFIPLPAHISGLMLTETGKGYLAGIILLLLSLASFFLSRLFEGIFHQVNGEEHELS